MTTRQKTYFISSSFNLSRQQLTVYHTAKVDELQPVQKEVVQLRLATFIDFYFGSLALVLSRFMKEGKLNCKEKIKFRTENLIT